MRLLFHFAQIKKHNSRQREKENPTRNQEQVIEYQFIQKRKQAEKRLDLGSLESDGSNER